MRSAWAALRGLVARLPIRWRLTLMSFGLLAVLLAALGTLLSISEEHALLTNQANALHREARLASGVLHTSSLSLAHTGQVIPAATGTIPTAAYPALDMLVARLANLSTGVAVLATNGSLLVSRATDPVATGPAAAPAVAVPANATRQALETSPSDDAYLLVRGTGGHSQLVVLLPVVNSLDGNAVAVLQINTSVAPIETTVATTRLLLALGIIAALVVAGALTFPLMSAGLRPLVSMERASRKIATGALSLRLEEPPANDEIGRLSRSFNSMVEQLEAAFTRQKRFAADVSHELRTPLTALGGEIEMLLLGADRGEAEAVRRLARGMYAEVERMRRLVEDLLTLTRLDEGRAELRMGSVELGRTLRDVVQCAQILAGPWHDHVERAQGRTGHSRHPGRGYRRGHLPRGPPPCVRALLPCRSCPCALATAFGRRGPWPLHRKESRRGAGGHDRHRERVRPWHQRHAPLPQLAVRTDSAAGRSHGCRREPILRCAKFPRCVVGKLP